MDGKPRCPECGALLGEAKTCEALFHAALAMEWVDPPRTSAAHHLLVGTYMLQHPSGFTQEGQSAFASVVINSVARGMLAEELRELNRDRFDQQKRNWNFKAKDPAPPRLREWCMTIADVVNGPAEELSERVWRWARSTSEEIRDPQD